MDEITRDEMVEVIKTAQNYIDALVSLCSVHCGGTHTDSETAATQVNKAHEDWRKLRRLLIYKNFLPL